MSIEFWSQLWKLVLIVGIGLFAALAVVVTVGGARDIQRLFRTLREQHARDQAAETNQDIAE